MPRPTRSKNQIVARLTEGSATMDELRAATGLSPNGVKSTISRLRNAQFRIFAESTHISGNPRYTLASGPGSLGANFVCPACSSTIRLGHISDHQSDCPFGQGALNGQH